MGCHPPYFMNCLHYCYTVILWLWDWPGPGCSGSSWCKLHSWGVSSCSHTVCDSLPDTWADHRHPAEVLLWRPSWWSWDWDTSEPSLWWRDLLERSQLHGNHLKQTTMKMNIWSSLNLSILYHSEPCCRPYQSVCWCWGRSHSQCLEVKL